MDNDILNVSGKTLKHLLNLMQRNALDFTALERMDANLDSLSKDKKVKKTRHKQRLSKHTDLSGQSFRGQKKRHSLKAGQPASKQTRISSKQTSTSTCARSTNPAQTHRVRCMNKTKFA